MFKKKKFWDKYFYIQNHHNLLAFIYKKELNQKMRFCNALISYKSNIKGKITLPHGLAGIFISAGATIGKNCTIFQQVTIGSNTLADSKSKGAPIIGDNCYIGVGAKIIGNAKIGNNVRIGANCVVVKDVPDNATIVCAQNRVILHEETRDNNFLSYGDYKSKQNKK